MRSDTTLSETTTRTAVKGCDMFVRFSGRAARERRRPVVIGIDRLAMRTSYVEDEEACSSLGLSFDSSWRAHYLGLGPKILDYAPNLPSWW